MDLIEKLELMPHTSESLLPHVSPMTSQVRNDHSDKSMDSYQFVNKISFEKSLARLRRNYCPQLNPNSPDVHFRHR